MDAKRFDLALDAGSHDAAVQAAKTLAQGLTIDGTPAFAINDYFLSGAQPVSTFGKLIKKALGPKEPIDPALIHGAPKRIGPATGVVLRDPDPTDDRLGARHILVMYSGSLRAPATVTRSPKEALARAEEARKKLLKGAPWEDIVSEYSDEPGAAARSGDLGDFPRGAMVPEFQAGLEKLRIGELSEVVETKFGYHLIWRTR